MLTESQLVRYSRHILLKGIGGIGQERLLSVGAELLGTSRALGWAATYLVAGGHAIRATESLALLGQSRSESSDNAVHAMNPDAGDNSQRWINLFDAGTPRDSGLCISGASIMWRLGEGCCLECFQLATRGSPPARDAPSLGAWAALCFQKAALGHLGESGELLVSESGARRGPLIRCARCTKAPPT